METTQNTISVLRQRNARSQSVYQNGDGTRNIQYLALQFEHQQKLQTPIKITEFMKTIVPFHPLSNWKEPNMYSMHMITKSAISATM